MSSDTMQSREQLEFRNWFGCSSLALFLYTGFCVALAIVTYLRPLPTFDRYLYAGAVASLRYSDPVTIHRIARAEFDTQPSPFPFESVAVEPYFADVRDNPYHFAQQLGLFRVKMGYVAAGYVLWRAGLPILSGLRLISACCLFFVGMVVLAWTRHALLAAMLLLTPPVLNLGRMVTADPFSTTMVFLALFALDKKRDLLATTLLIASIVVRSDNVVLVLILLAWMVWSRHLRLPVGALYAALALAACALVNRIAGIYGWRVLMQHSFIKPEIEPISHPVLISFAGYLHALAGLRAIPYTFMTVWILVAAAVWKWLPEGSILRNLLPVAGIYIVVRLLIFPNFDDRVFVWAYLLAGVALIRMARFPIPEN
ncbi:MAG TPA: hypothetical protein VKH40_13930 [Alloacidobacterium sp.]|nr:hypothetical protein [Alloacidobacterium sp.]